MARSYLWALILALTCHACETLELSRIAPCVWPADHSHLPLLAAPAIIVIPPCPVGSPPYALFRWLSSDPPTRTHASSSIHPAVSIPSFFPSPRPVGVGGGGRVGNGRCWAKERSPSKPRLDSALVPVVERIHDRKRSERVVVVLE